MIHPQFKLNGQSFSSRQDLEDFAKHWTSMLGEYHTIGKFILEWLNTTDVIHVKTSGSTGTPKLMALEKTQVQNSARATIRYFELFENTKALLCMSSEYIGGKMMLVRAMTAGWDLQVVAPQKNPLDNLAMEFDFAAMVPFQVFHSLLHLHRVKKIIIGGGSLPKSLGNRLQDVNTQAFETYGMTETISHIAVRAINGKLRSSIFTALPEVGFSQTNKGCLVIKAPLISEDVLVTNDVVEWVSPTKFRFLGRIDNVINTGGIKIHPEQIEQKLSAYIEEPFFIASEEDEALGQRVILILESILPIEQNYIMETFNRLSPYERPKKIYTVPQFSYTETEKIRRSEVMRLLKN